MKKFCYISIIIFCTPIFYFAIANENGDWSKIINMPEWVRDSFRKNNLDSKYDYSFVINPMYLRGDFNGDSNPDIAILVQNRSSKKMGIIVFHFDSYDYFIFGAGKIFGNGGDDFGWMSNWEVKIREKKEQNDNDKQPASLVAEAIYVEMAESASAIIYWNGSKYIWYQQGD